jgi:hypothetical protein
MEGMEQKTLARAEEELLKTEKGRFLLELDRLTPEVDICIQAVRVDDKLKEEFRKSFKTFRENVISAVQKEEIVHISNEVDIYDMARGCVTKILNLIDISNKEQLDLFRLVRNLILEARDSAKGWKHDKSKYFDN